MTPVFAYIQEKRAAISAMPGVKGLGGIAKKGAELYTALSAAEQEARIKKYDDEMKAFNEWKESEIKYRVSCWHRSTLAQKKSIVSEMKAVKQEKLDKKQAKIYRKEAKEAKAAGGEELAAYLERKSASIVSPAKKKRA